MGALIVMTRGAPHFVLFTSVCDRWFLLIYLNLLDCSSRAWIMCLVDAVRSNQAYFISEEAYMEPSIISGTGADIWSKTNFGPTGHHHLRSSPLPRVFTVPRASAMMIYYLYVHSYMFRSYDHHQAEKYITTLGLLN
jgi:hypothetical protein